MKSKYTVRNFSKETQVAHLISSRRNKHNNPPLGKMLLSFKGFMWEPGWDPKKELL